MIPFIFLTVFPRKVIQDIRQRWWIQSWFITDLFPIRTFLDWGSTGNKQTSKGLFIMYCGVAAFLFIQSSFFIRP